MFEFELQRFDDETATEQAADTGEQQSAIAEQEALPEELNGLPEDVARETFNEWKSTQQATGEQEQNEQHRAQKTEESVPYARFKEKVDEANQLKAQLAEYQRRVQQQLPLQPTAQPQQPARPPVIITPEIAQKINEVVDERAMSLSGLTKKEVEELDFVDDGDIKLEQWRQSKASARTQVFEDIKQAQFRLAQQEQQAQRYAIAQQAAVQSYLDYTRKEIETVANFADISNFAANEYFQQQPPAIKDLIASSYLRTEQRIATPAELFVVQRYYEQAKAAFNSRSNSAKQNAQAQRTKQAAGLPRTDQLKGASATSDGQLSVGDIEKLLQGDFTKIDQKTQFTMLGFS